jgi:transposase
VSSEPSRVAAIAEQWMSFLVAVRTPMRLRSSKPDPKVVELKDDDLNQLDGRAAAEAWQHGDGATVCLLIASHRELLDLIKDKNISLARLRKMLFGASTEKTKNLLGDNAKSDADQEASQDDGDSESAEASEDQPPKRPRGHGRNGAKDYPGAEQVAVSHETHQPGDDCPACAKGKIYDTGRPGVLIRIVGQAPLRATVYQLQKLRCNLCGALFTAQPPEGVGPRKYDATTGTIIALLKYGSGLPFNRQQRLQGSLGVPLPAATQWDIVHAKANRIAPAHEELIRQAAQGAVLYNDDTNNKILEFMGERARKAALEEEASNSSADGSQQEKTRTGMFTTGIVSQCADRQIAVFFTGRRHSGENLGDVLRQRADELEPPIQMCDALSRNIPKELQTILANCLAHSRRYFADVVAYWENECRYVLDALKEIYKNDADARKQQLSPEARLIFHQTHSRPVMDELHKWLNRQFDERLVEPNSGLGEAISYMLNHWNALTLFLRKAGAPLDNNIAERALKKIILHRKNSYFYRSQNGARVGDLYTSLIYTCELNGVNPFDYLTELERHAEKLDSHPEQWTPWNYRRTLQSLNTNSAAARASHVSTAADPATGAVGQC